MSKRRKKDWAGEDKKLWDFIYENELENDVVQLSQYHHRILNKIDVWSGAKKYWVKGTKGSQKYQNINELITLIKEQKLCHK